MRAWNEIPSRAFVPQVRRFLPCVSIVRLVIMSANNSALLHIPGQAIRKLVAEHPSYWSSFYSLSHRNAMLMLNLLGEAISLSVRARICRRLLSLAESLDEVALTQEQLAKILGLARGTVHAELVKLTSMGAIEHGYGRIRIVDRAILEALKDEQ